MDDARQWAENGRGRDNVVELLVDVQVEGDRGRLQV